VQSHAGGFELLVHHFGGSSFKSASERARKAREASALPRLVHLRRRTLAVFCAALFRAFFADLLALIPFSFCAGLLCLVGRDVLLTTRPKVAKN
jgi:hypothetical protein